MGRRPGPSYVEFRFRGTAKAFLRDSLSGWQRDWVWGSRSACHPLPCLQRDSLSESWFRCTCGLDIPADVTRVSQSVGCPGEKPHCDTRVRTLLHAALRPQRWIYLHIRKRPRQRSRHRTFHGSPVRALLRPCRDRRRCAHGMARSRANRCCRLRNRKRDRGRLCVPPLASSVVIGLALGSDVRSGSRIYSHASQGVGDFCFQSGMAGPSLSAAMAIDDISCRR